MLKDIINIFIWLLLILIYSHRSTYDQITQTLKSPLLNIMRVLHDYTFSIKLFSKNFTKWHRTDYINIPSILYV